MGVALAGLTLTECKTWLVETKEETSSKEVVSTSFGDIGTEVPGGLIQAEGSDRKKKRGSFSYGEREEEKGLNSHKKSKKSARNKFNNVSKLNKKGQLYHNSKPDSKYVKKSNSDSNSMDVHGSDYALDTEDPNILDFINNITGADYMIGNLGETLKKKSDVDHTGNNALRNKPEDDHTENINLNKTNNVGAIIADYIDDAENRKHSTMKKSVAKNKIHKKSIGQNRKVEEGKEAEETEVQNEVEEAEVQNEAEVRKEAKQSEGAENDYPYPDYEPGPIGPQPDQPGLKQPSAAESQDYPGYADPYEPSYPGNQIGAGGVTAKNIYTPTNVDNHNSQVIQHRRS